MSRLKTLFQRLHEQSAWQILVSYGIGSWIILQVTETVSSLIGLPLWMGQAVLFTLLLGLPVVLVTALVRAMPASEGDGASSWRGRLFTWRNVIVGGVVAFTVLGIGTTGYLGMRTAGLGSIGTLIAKGVVDEAGQVVLADVENRTDDPGLSEVMGEILRVDLAQSTALSVVAPDAVAATLRRMGLSPDTELTEERARELAIRNGVKAVLVGSVAQAGSSLVLSARLVAAANGETLAALRETASSEDDVVASVDRLSAQLRARVGESLRSIRADAPLADVTTTSMDALRAYAQALTANNGGDPERAIALLEEALADDSLFAMAHRKLAILLSNQSRQAERAHAAFVRAYELRDRLTEREAYLAQAAYHSYVEGDVERANDVYTTLLETYPDDATALNNLAVGYSQLGRPTQAEALYTRAVASGVRAGVTLINALETQYRTGYTERSDSTLAILIETYPDHPSLPYLRSSLATANFRYDEALPLLQEWRGKARGNPASEAGARLTIASLSFVRGRMREALEEALEAYDFQADAGLDFVPHARAVFAAGGLSAMDLYYYRLPEGVPDRFERLRQEADYESLPVERRDDLGFAVLFADAGYPERARELLAMYEADAPVPPGEDRPPDILGVEGAIAMAEERYDDAIAVLSEALEAGHGCTLCARQMLGRAWLDHGRPHSAIEAFEGYLGEKNLSRVQLDAFLLWRVLRDLAATYERVGRNAEAVDTHRRFIELWKDADADLQHYVEASRAAVARLGDAAR